ncbi:MAG: M20/M25/M40 family metallo-hydrolase, partial [Actinobacteria bacterium]|nr:M20/M25/M40 family metallo-hydrolase [Actinomycetota bacterium]
MPASGLDLALAQRTLELVDIPSESRDEAHVYAYLEACVPLEKTFSDGGSLLYAKRTGKPLVLLAAHTDTVPAQGNLPGRVEDGWVIGLGATDMKGGLAVIAELGRWAAETELAYDLALLFFPREELGPAENPLPEVFERTAIVDEAKLVICLEPTDNTLQLGCLGNLNARVVFEGRSAHSARPWLGVNAIGLALEGLRPALEAEPRDVEIEGLVFREVISVTELHGGIASNVIPARAEATLNFRYAPDRTPESAAERVRQIVGRDVEILSNAPAAHVALASP